MFTAMILAFAIGAPFIAWLRKKQGKGQPIRADGPEGHLLTKKGTPTMGGLIILISLGIASLLWADLQNPYVWSVLVVTLELRRDRLSSTTSRRSRSSTMAGFRRKLRLGGSEFGTIAARCGHSSMLVAEWGGDNAGPNA
jgi:hypothetical protein